MDLRKLIKPNIAGINKYEPGVEKKDHIKLSSNENPRGPHPTIVAAVTRALEISNRYPPSGSPELTAALARRHGVSDEEVLVGNGSNEIIDLIVRAFANPGDNVVYPIPSFIVYGLIAQICGVEGRGVLCHDYRLDLDGMREAVDQNTRVVMLCNPNNPTSTYLTANEVSRFLDGLREDILVIMDEAYYDYVDAGDYPDSLTLRRKHNNIVILRTFSKFHSIAGVRVGYAIADPVVVEVLHKVRQPFNVSRLAQAAGLAALECHAELLPMAKEAIAERNRVRDEVLKLGVACPPTQTNFVFVDLGDSDLDLYAALADRGVIVRRMGQFGSAHNTYRISIGAPDENDKLIEALRGVLAPSEK